jgi:hypothetical protein
MLGPSGNASRKIPCLILRVRNASYIICFTLNLNTSSLEASETNKKNVKIEEAKQILKPIDKKEAVKSRSRNRFKKKNDSKNKKYEGVASNLKRHANNIKSKENICDNTLTWYNIKDEDFEGEWPNDWELTGSPTWADEFNRYYEGDYSGWCAASWYWAPGPYDNNMNAWMKYGSFDLSDASDAEVTFYYWNNSEYEKDYFKWLASTDEINDFSGYRLSGNSNGWQSMNFDLTNVPNLGNLCGESQVWIAFVFSSDEQNTYEGAYIDDIVIKKEVETPQCDLSIESITINPYTTPFVTEQITVTVKIKCSGGDCDSDFDVDYFENEPSPPSAPSVGQYFARITDMSENEPVEIDFSVNKTLWYNERCDMYILVDSQDEVTETNEDNNVNEERILIEWCESPTETNYQWPMSPFDEQHQINAVLDECRGTSSPHHFHQGIDIQGTSPTPVYSVSSGLITLEDNKQGLYAGNFWYYHLQDIPSEIENREWKTIIERKELLGYTDDIGKNHLHFNDGPEGSEINPLRNDDGINPFADGSEPTIHEVKFYDNGDYKNEVDKDQLIINQKYDIIVKAHDTVAGNTGSKCGIYKIGYKKDDGEYTYNLQFDEWYSAGYLQYVYHPDQTTTGPYRYIITNKYNKDDAISFDELGAHQIDILAEDITGRPDSIEISVTVKPDTEVEKKQNADIPNSFCLYQNFPNPFNPLTQIEYDLPKSTEVSISLYNLQGQKIKTLVNEFKPAGRYVATWNGLDDTGKKVASGVYLYIMRNHHEMV